jgi:hypothetical protein
MSLQTADSFGHSAKSQHWRTVGVTGLMCAEGEETQKGVSSLLCDVLSNTCFVSVRALFMYDVSGEAAVCCRHTFRQLLQQTDTHEGYIFRVSVTQPYLDLLHQPLSPVPHNVVCDAKIYLQVFPC